jgi:hypothetical protein
MMKHLFALLLIVNIFVVYYFSYLTPSKDSAGKDDYKNELRLVQSVPQNTGTDTVAEPRSSEGPEALLAEKGDVDDKLLSLEPRKRCITLSYFSRLADLDEFLSDDQLPENLSSKWRKDTTRTVLGYRVHTPNYQTIDEAKKVQQLLITEGIETYRGFDSTYVNLGYFKNKGNADLHLKKISTLGIQALITPRIESEHRYSLELKVDSSEEDALSSLIEARYSKNMNIVVKDC